MDTSKKSIFRTVINVAKSHIRSIVDGIRDNATSVAKEDYGVDLKIIKPSVSKVLQDLKTWNEQRKEDKRLSREEMKELAKAILVETKKVLLDPASVRNEEMDEINAIMAELEEEFDIDFDDDTYGVENEEINVEQERPLDSPTPECLALFTLGILLSVTNDQRFVNYLSSRMDIIKESIGITVGTDTNVIADRSVIAEMDDIVDAKINSEIAEDMVEEVENTNSAVNLDLTINSEEAKAMIGTESDSNSPEVQAIEVCTRILRSYQRSETFMMSMDRVMTLLNKIISAYNNEQGIEDAEGFAILSRNPILYQIVDVFGFNYLDAVSFFAIFSLFEDSMTDEELEILEKIISDTSSRLDAYQKTDEM